MPSKRLFGLAVVMMIAAAGVFIPVRAQDSGTLSEEELALVQRVLDARDQYQAFTSVVEDSIFARSQGATIRMGDQFRTIETASNWIRHVSMINGQDGRNIAAAITANVENSQTTPEGKTITSTVSLSIEARLVSDALYVFAVYPETVAPSDDLPTLPDGWVEIANVNDWPILRGVGLEDLLDDSSIMDDPDLFKSAVTAAHVEPTTLDDGSPAEIITLQIGAEGIKALYLRQLDPDKPATQLFTYTGEGSGGVLELTLTADGVPYRSISTTILRMPNIDPAIVGLDPRPGATVDYALDSVNDETYSQINEPLEPAAVPEPLAE